MKITDTLEFPDVQKILEEAKNVDEVWQKLIDWFSTSPEDLERVACANKLIELNNMRKSDMIVILDQDVKEIKDLLRAISRKYGRAITVTRRQKSLIGVIAKMILVIQRGEKQGKTVLASLEDLKDFIGIRIVAQTGSKETVKSIQMAYEIMNELLTYFVVTKKNTLLPLEYDRTVKKVEGIVIPKRSDINPVFRDSVKDYFRYPKENGYQCLHAVAASEDRRIEVQVRTQMAEIRAEYYEDSTHERHKLLRYEGIEIPVNLSKVDIEGVTVLPSGDIYDRVGLVSAIDPLNLLC